LFREDAPEDTKQYARKNLAIRFDYLERVLGSKTFLMGEQFTIADGYLFTVLSWGQHVNLDIGKWPQLKRFVERVGARPHVIEALKPRGRRTSATDIRIASGRWMPAVCCYHRQRAGFARERTQWLPNSTSS